MEKLNKFLEGKDFDKTESEIKAFEDGETEIDLTKLEVEARVVDFGDGKEKTRYVLKDGDNQYWAGNQVMQGIKAAFDKEAERCKVLKQGSGLKTSYMVVALE